VTAEPAGALAHDVLFAACLLVVIGGLALDADQCDVRLVERDGVCIVSAERFGQYWSAPALHLWRMHSEKATDGCEFQLDQHGEEEFWSA
jgi:hypothetical protein